MDRFNEVLRFLPVRIRALVTYDKRLMGKCEKFKVSEVRLRVNRPVIFMFGKEEYVLEQVITDVSDIRQSLQFISDYSLYAHEEDVGNGFITLKGGHRAGVAGQAVTDKGVVINQKNIGFINIRVAHEVKGCADGIMSFLLKGGKVEHTLIVSAPGGGKTTLMRDVVRQLSYGIRGVAYKVGVVDERSEIAACFEGIPQNDVGPRTDVIDQIKKAEGMMLLLRSMSPDIIAVDELAGKEDAEAVKNLFCCGCTVIATVHGGSIDEVLQKPYISEVIGKYGFRRLIMLDNEKSPGCVKELREL